MKVAVVTAIVSVSLALVGGRGAEAEPEVKVTDNLVSIENGGRTIFEYRYQDVPFKPCVQTFYTPAGVQVLRDAPHDHLHHHALMYAIAVDGVDFWQEANAPGKQVHRSFGDFGDTNPKASEAGLTEELEWVKPEGNEVLLKEQRTIAAVLEEGLGASLLTWTSTFELPDGKESAQLTGSHYFGLGMRFVESMDKVGTFFNAANGEGEVVRGTEKLTRANWCAYTAEADGKPVTVAMFDHPDNARHPAYWFTMTAPFSYLSATLNLWKEPMTLKAGDTLALRYGAALWDGHQDKETVEKLYQHWLGLVD